MKKSTLINFLLGTIVLILAAAAFIPLLPYSRYVDENNLEHFTSPGSNVAGMLAPIFSFIGSILVYFAFRAQIKANTLTQEQFRHSQLIGLIDNLSNKITNLSISEDGKEIKGYDIFQFILNKLREKQLSFVNREDQMTNIISTIPKEISLQHFERFLLCYSKTEVSINELNSNAKKLRQDLVNQHEPITWLHEEFDFNSQKYPNEKKILRGRIAKEYFSSMDYDYQMNFYDLAFGEISNEYETFLEIYFTSVFAILDLAYNSSKNIEENKKYIKNVFTNQERILLFQWMMSGRISRQTGIYLLELDVFNMILKGKYFLSTMTVERYERDIAYIKPLVYAKD